MVVLFSEIWNQRNMWKEITLCLRQGILKAGWWEFGSLTYLGLGFTSELWEWEGLWQWFQTVRDYKRFPIPSVSVFQLFNLPLFFGISRIFLCKIVGCCLELVIIRGGWSEDAGVWEDAVDKQGDINSFVHHWSKLIWAMVVLNWPAQSTSLPWWM